MFAARARTCASRVWGSRLVLSHSGSALLDEAPPRSLVGPPIISSLALGPVPAEGPVWDAMPRLVLTVASPNGGPLLPPVHTFQLPLLSIQTTTSTIRIERIELLLVLCFWRDASLPWAHAHTRALAILRVFSFLQLFCLVVRSFDSQAPTGPCTICDSHAYDQTISLCSLRSAICWPVPFWIPTNLYRNVLREFHLFLMV